MYEGCVEWPVLVSNCVDKAVFAYFEHVRSCRSVPGCVCVVDLVLQGNGRQVRRHECSKIDCSQELNWKTFVSE